MNLYLYGKRKKKKIKFFLIKKIFHLLSEILPANLIRLISIINLCPDHPSIGETWSFNVLKYDNFQKIKKKIFLSFSVLLNNNFLFFFALKTKKKFIINYKSFFFHVKNKQFFFVFCFSLPLIKKINVL